MTDEKEDNPTMSGYKQSQIGQVLTRDPMRGNPEARWLEHVQGIYQLMERTEVRHQLQGCGVATGSGDPLGHYQSHVCHHPSDAFPVVPGFFPQSPRFSSIPPNLSGSYYGLDELSLRCNHDAASSNLQVSPSYELLCMGGVHPKIENNSNEHHPPQDVEPTLSRLLDPETKMHQYHQLSHPVTNRETVKDKSFSQEANSKVFEEPQARYNDHSPPVEKNATIIHDTSPEIKTGVNDVSLEPAQTVFATSVQSKRRSVSHTSVIGHMDLIDVSRKAESPIKSFEESKEFLETKYGSTCTPVFQEPSTVLVPGVFLGQDLDQECRVKSESNKSNTFKSSRGLSLLQVDKLCTELLAANEREKKDAFTIDPSKMIQDSVQLMVSEVGYSTLTSLDDLIGPTSPSGSTKTIQMETEFPLQSQWQERDEKMLNCFSKADSQASDGDRGAHSENPMIQFSEDSSEYSGPELKCKTQTQETNSTGTINYQDQPSLDNKCPICEDKVSGYHYGMYSCESCKGFFKRTIHSQRHKNLHCSFSGECVVTLRNRKQCASCRFQKCLSLGMKLEAIRQNRQRGGRSLYHGSSEQRRLSRLKEEQEVLKSKSKKYKRKSTKTDSTDDVNSKPKTSLASPCKKEPSESIPDTESGMESKLAGLPQLIRDLAVHEECYARQTLAQCCLDTLQVEKNLLETISHFVNHQMVPLVRWAKGLPLYSQLVIEDQVRLLQNSILNLLCLNLIFYCLDRACRLLLPQGRIIDLTTFNASKFHKLVPRITSISHQLHSAGLDLTSFVCLKLIVLLRPDTASLQDSTKVQTYQDMIQDMLLDHVTTNRPQDSHNIGNLMLGLAAIERVVQQVSQETDCNVDVLDQLLQHSGPDTRLTMPWIWTKPHGGKS